MVMTISEQIVSLEEQLVNTKGPGSKIKKAEIQREITALKKADKPTVEEAEEMTPEEANTVIPDVRPKPTKWVKVTMEQVKKAESDFKLCGFDPDKMIALIRD